MGHGDWGAGWCPIRLSSLFGARGIEAGGLKPCKGFGSREPGPPMRAHSNAIFKKFLIVCEITYRQCEAIEALIIFRGMAPEKIQAFDKAP